MPMPKHLNAIGMGFFLDNYEYLASRPERNPAKAGRDVGSAMRKRCLGTLCSSVRLLSISHGKHQEPTVLSKLRLGLYW